MASPAAASADPELPPEVLAAHRAAMDRGEPVYVDPATGDLVMTAAALAARGSCCGCGCRHCPYPADERRRAGRPDA